MTRRRSLAGRVALAAMASGALAGSIAAGAAVVAVDQMASRLADRRLSGAADVLAGEIDEAFEEGEWEPLGEIVDDENAELVTSGVRLAVFSRGHRVAGDPWVPVTAAGACELHGALGARIRACARAHDAWVLVAATESDAEPLRAIYASAGFGALLLGGAVGALASRRLTRWALRPLSDLADRIRSIRPAVSGPESLGDASDVEEVDLIRTALVELLERVDSLLSLSRRFAAEAAHELRMPLTTIRGELDLLIEQAGERGGPTALARIRDRARQLSDLLERLLVLAAPIEGASAGFEAVSVADVVQDAVRDLPVEQRSRIRLDLRGDGMVRGDEILLSSLVANALDNAWKFSGALPIDVTLEETCSPAHAGGRSPEAPGERVVVLEFRDRGPGIPDRLRERVFEPFYRARADATPGHGLGLSLIAHIARAHGGSAAFAEVAEGTRLRVTLPGWRAAPAAPPGQSPASIGA